MAKPGLPPIKYVQIQTHSRCNADCVFCPFSESYHAANPGQMSLELWNKIMQDLQPFADGINKGGKICVYLQQEPLIDKRIYDFILDVHKNFPGTTVEISTNCAALTPKAADRLCEIWAGTGRKHEIWLSAHGVDKETLEHVMAIDFEKSRENIIYFLRKSDGRLNVKIRGAGESKDGKHVYFTGDQFKAYWHKVFEDEKLNTKGVHLDSFRFHDRAGEIHRLDRDAYKLNFGKVRDIGPGHKPFSCPRITEWLHITWEGKILICCHDYSRSVKLGDINSQSIVEYFQGETYRDLVDKVTGKKESHENFICKRCLAVGG